MKKYIVLFNFIFISPFLLKTEAQISEIRKVPETHTLGKWMVMGSSIGEISYRIYDSDTIYTFMFKNAKYHEITDLKSFSFSGKENTLENFYNILLSFFSSENEDNPEYKMAFKIGEEDIFLQNSLDGGFHRVYLSADGGYMLLSKKGIEKLFAKR